MNCEIVVRTMTVFSICLMHSISAFAGKDLICYEVGGTVETENVSDTVQVGTIYVELTNKMTGEVEFAEEGLLIGTITDSDMITTTLSHHAQFSSGNKFTTVGDKAVITHPFVRRVLEDESGSPILGEDGQPIPCSFFIAETLTDITKGSKFFAKSKKVLQSVHADGYVSRCPDENSNFFELSGEFCKK